MARKGGLSHINYKETRGLKVTAGQFVTKGSILTREGNKWRAGINTAGLGTVYALCDGKVYFKSRKGTYHSAQSATTINIETAEAKKSSS